MVHKYLASLEGRKRKPVSDSEPRRSASLLAAVKSKQISLQERYLVLSLLI